VTRPAAFVSNPCVADRLASQGTWYGEGDVVDERRSEGRQPQDEGESYGQVVPRRLADEVGEFFRTPVTSRPPRRQIGQGRRAGCANPAFDDVARLAATVKAASNVSAAAMQPIKPTDRPLCACVTAGLSPRRIWCAGSEEPGSIWPLWARVVLRRISLPVGADCLKAFRNMR